MKKKCKSCQSDIDIKATKCPKCGTDQRNFFRRHPIITGILGLIILGAVIGGSSGGNKGTSVPAQADKSGSQNSSSPAASKSPTAMQTLLDISGSGTKSTLKFTAGGDWDLNWTYDCSGFSGGQGNFIVTVYNDGGSISYQNNGVNQLGKSDSGVEHYHNGGTFYLEVNSECSWTINVKG